MAHGEWQALTSNDNPSSIIDFPVSVTCPRCSAHTSPVAVSIPRYAQLQRYTPSKILVGYGCTACGAPIGLLFSVNGDYNNCRCFFSLDFEELERPMETFEYQYLPEPVASDFKEALTSYSHGCPNAAAAMCRRTVQSIATDLGATGKAKVEKQILDAKETAGLDDQTFEELEKVVIGGHDGVHPNLPPVSIERATMLVRVMKDVLHQLYVRKGQIMGLENMRKDAIADMKRGLQGQ